MGFRFFASRAAVAVLLLVAVSCSSIKGAKRISGEALMYGMVYTGENMPVSNAEVKVDGKAVAVTDAQGRFVLVSKQRNDFTLALTKTGYETIEGVFRFEPMEVIHLVMVNADQLVYQAELAMDEGRYRDVGAYCDRALVLNKDRIDASYLKALSFVRLREYDSARLVLTELQSRIGERDYIRRVLEDIGDEQ
jgi:hypothetical protein